MNDIGNRRTTARPFGWRTAAAALLTLALVGCVSTDPVQPTASPVPTATAGASTAPPGPTPAPRTPSPAPPTPTIAPPTPIPTPVDIEAEFVRQMLAAESLEADIVGALSYSGIVGTLEGQSRSDSDGNSYMLMRFTVPDVVDTTTEQLIVGSQTFKATSGGPWVLQPAPDSGTPPQTGVDTILMSVAGVSDQGLVTRDGRQLHHLLPPPDVTVDPAAFGLVDPIFRGVSASLEFFAEPDGTPAIFTIAAEWEQVVSRGNRVPVSLSMDFLITDLDAGTPLLAPADAWEYYVSDIARLTTAHPQGWAEAPDSGGELFSSPNGDWIWVNSAGGVLGADLRAFTDEHIRFLRQLWADGDWHVVVDEATDAQIDVKAARITHLSDAAAGLYLGDAVVIIGNRAYILQCALYDSSPAEGKAFFEDFLTTVHFD